MARTNKYTSINFNDIFEKKSNKPSSSPLTSTPSSSSSSSRNHGGMLVLTRPSPKPLQPQTPKPLVQSPKPSSGLSPNHRSEPEPEPISLRPLGRTGSSSLSPSSPSLPIPQDAKDRESPVSLKPEPFVPPHLRPGFAGKEERFGQNGLKNQGVRSREVGPGQVQYGSHSEVGPGQVQYGSHSGYDENGRPKSGGGYERMRRGSDSEQGDMNRPSSSGNRPGSGGRYGSSYRSPTQF